MAQYIPKDDLVAEISKRITDAPIDCYGHQRVWAYNDVKDIINTLEVKEVDLEKELVDYHNDNFSPCNDGTLLSSETGSELTWYDYERIAKHFFELGLKSQKGE